MRLDTANRSFVSLIAIAGAPLILAVLFGCAPLALVEAWLPAHEHRSYASGPAIWVSGIFLATTGVGLALGARSLWRQQRATHRLVAGLSAHRLTIEGSVAAAAERVGLARIDLLDAAQPYSFTYGLWAPRVAISRGVVEAVSTSELEAILAHEGYHVRNRDPLKMLIARTLPTVLFYIPMLRHLLDRYLAGRELAADRAAVDCCGESPLASALYKVVAPSEASQAAVAAMGGTELLAIRLTQLESGEEPAPPAISRLVVAATVVGLTLLAAGLTATAIALVGEVAITPIPAILHGGTFDAGGALVCGAVCLGGAGILYRWLLARSR